MLGIFYRHIWLTSWRYLWVVSVIFIVMLLQWLLNIQELGFFLFGGQIPLSEGLEIIWDGLAGVFSLPTDFTPIAFILISLLQSSALVLLLILRNARQAGKKAAKQAGSLGVAVVGAGCVACGGSLMTPLLGLLASNVSIGFASALGDILLALAIILSYMALKDVSNSKYFKLRGK